MLLRTSSRGLYRAIFSSSPAPVRRALFTTTPPRRIVPIHNTNEPASRLSDNIAVDDLGNDLPSSRSVSKNEIPSDSMRSQRSQTASGSTEMAPSSSPLLPYHVSRTPSNNLPVYHDTRNGNTRKETIIRKISGDARPLRDAIRELLGVEAEKVWIGKVTGHVYVKGHHKAKIERFLAEKGF
ncbi:uncharacterized protein PV09_05864 [Verruconis gallopava]|uniref:Large ribosomal subunit protein mL49 n=1 Tax=Verruconis gallopava TaxID=253628 RepID=A0A0D2A7Q7_9PEZI|nr:uncharacterized protein PV09_05864 [Verruconis gallopava]KIW02803.1 hypothetical protein PV09_05864 [Verruconis gallopava]